MNSMRLLRSSRNIKIGIIAVARYGKPLNRWQYYYANEDGVFEEDFNWIEQKTMPQPFPKESFTFSHKGFPKDNFPLTAHDFRYNYRLDRLPRRHHCPDHLFKLYNFSDYDAMMHGIQWADYELDYQLADPMESNHYIQGRSPSFAVCLALGIILFTFIYPMWGYGVLDYVEDITKLRKNFQFPDASLVFTWFGSFPGHNNGIPIEDWANANENLGARQDKDGNILPNNIRKYYFEDEYTYRV